MMLYKLSLKNIKKSFKDYAIYFFTLILGVAIFYVFNAIDSQTAMMNISSSKQKIIELMTSILSLVSVFVSFILGFLIIYASRFLMKRRNKEFGIYLTLGMSKRKISQILFFETLFIGILSLAVGLIVGIVLSQLMSIFVANMFEADLTKFTFTFSASACFKTLIYFSVMYLLVMLFNTITISQCQLIDLLQGNKRNEVIKLKNPILCTIIFIVSVIVLGYAYYMVTNRINMLDRVEDIMVPILLGCLSTFFIFWSLSGLILRIVRSMKKLYFKNLNSFVLRQISSKINTTVASMTVICLMLFITICVLSSSLSIKNSMTKNLIDLAPADVEIFKNLDIEENNNRYTQQQIADSKLSVQQTLKKMDFDITKYYRDILDFNLYATNDVLLKDTLGNYLKVFEKEFPYLIADTAEPFIKLSDYNRLAQLFHFEQLSLKHHEYCLVADFDQWVAIRNNALKTKPVIHLLGKDYYPKYQECKNGFAYMSTNHINIGLFVVPDDAVNESIRATNIIVANYKANSEEKKQEIEDKLLALDHHSYISHTTIEATTKIALYEGSVGLGALVTFIGLYLGIIFLMSSAAILALKELSESSDNKERYQMLRKIGTDEKMINQALFKQIAIFFMFPLILAIIHSIFGIRFCDYILSTFGNEQLLPSIIMTAIFIIIIYGGYFIITYICSKNIIKERI